MNVQIFVSILAIGITILITNVSAQKEPLQKSDFVLDVEE